MRNRPNGFLKVGHTSGGDEAMTFAEIARRLGWPDPLKRGRGAVWMCYANAMRKLRQNPDDFKAFRELVAHRRRLREGGNA